MTKLPMKVASVQLTILSVPILVVSVYFTVLNAFVLLSSILAPSFSTVMSSLTWFCVLFAFTWSLLRIQMQALEFGTETTSTAEVFVNITVFMTIAGFITAVFF